MKFPELQYPTLKFEDVGGNEDTLMVSFCVCDSVSDSQHVMYGAGVIPLQDVSCLPCGERMSYIAYFCFHPQLFDISAGGV